MEPNETALLRLLHRWRDEPTRSGRTIERIVVAYESDRDGFWLARWLANQGIEVHVIHSSSVAGSREHKRAKTDRLDTAMLSRVFLGWLRGERSLQNGCGADTRGRGRQAAEPPAREIDRRLHAHRQPAEGRPGAARHPRLQPEAAQGGSASGSAAYTRRGANSAKSA